MRVLIHLAVQPDSTATIHEIAEHFAISRNHLMKVVHRAVQAGYVEGVRGRSGGLKLSKPAREINIGQVLRATEDWSLVECFDPQSNRCCISSACGLRPALRLALEAFFAVLDSYSLADITSRRNPLVQLLGLKTG